MNITAQCSTEFRAVHDSGLRTKRILWIVLHSTEGGTARSVARYFAYADPDSDVGSTNLVVDDIECYRTLNDNVVPWGAPGANEQGWHIEQCGFSRWTLANWMVHRKTIQRAAFKSALRCRDNKIPARWVTPEQIRCHMSGVCTHADITKAWPDLAKRYGSHSDPGTGYPKTYFMRQLRSYLADLEAV